ncbi:MAG: HD domain-containing protein, partial [Anaerolineales bacterium]|nr:HD domain-containing protein [Anaerolineales bacterium]
MNTNLSFWPLLERIRATVPAGVPVYLVGGAIRDALRGYPIHDYDFATPDDALKVARMVANQLGAAYFPLDVERATARVIYTSEEGVRTVLDFAALRGPDLESDLRDRDFTLNAMAIEIRSPQRLIDPMGGAADLQANLLRACSSRAFQNDPVRILRAIRGASAFDLRIEAVTISLMRQAIAGLELVSAERIRDELLKILAGPRPHIALQTLEHLGALPRLLPEVLALNGVQQTAPHTLDVWRHTLATLRYLEQILAVLKPGSDPQLADNLTLGLLVLHLKNFRSDIWDYLQAEFVPERSRRQALFLAALYHDIGKPQTWAQETGGRIRFIGHEQIGEELVASRATALKMSNQEVEWISAVVRHHMRPTLLAHELKGPSRRTIYRFYRDAGLAGVGVALLSLADLWATYGATMPQERWNDQLEVVHDLLQAWWRQQDETVA